MACKTPVALIVFRRPGAAARVFEAIRRAQPPKLFVIADGPRTDEEARLCQETRAITEQVDWECEVIRLYSYENLGARRRISSGLDAVFDQVESAVILEDDCLPDPSFFLYCDELLDRYWTDPRIWNITGDNFQQGHWRGDGSYYFSHYFHGWGWATWRRAWRQYDHEMAGWPAFRDGPEMDRLLDDPLEAAYWRGFLDTLYATGKPDAWDYIWMLTCWMHNGLTVVPNVNLVSNIGFGADATNTTTEGGWISSRPAGSIGPLDHPAAICRDRDADLYTFDHVFPGARFRREQSRIYRLRRRLWQWRQAVRRKT